MSDDTRAPRQPFDDGPQEEGGDAVSQTRGQQDAQAALEAALARSRGIGDDGDVRSGEVLAGDELGLVGRAEEPTDPSLVSHAAAAFPEEPTGDPHATVGLDRDELAAVLANGPVATAGDRELGEAPAPVASPDEAEAAGNEEAPASDAEPEVPVTHDAPVLTDEPSELDVTALPQTEPIPAEERAADALGAESVPAITVDATGAATAPDDGQPAAARRTLEIDRTAARVAAAAATAPGTADAEVPLEAEAAGGEGSLPADGDDVPEDEVPSMPGDDVEAGAGARSDEPTGDDVSASQAGAPADGRVRADLDTDRADADRAEVAVTETVTEVLDEDGHVEAIGVSRRVDVVDAVDADPVAAALPGEEEALAPDSAPSTDDAPQEGEPGPLEHADTSGEEATASTEAAAGVSALALGAASSSDSDDETFAPLRLSAPTDSDDLAPIKPRRRGNRMFAVFVALVAAVVFAAAYLLAFALLRTAFNSGLDPIGEASQFALTAAFTVPVTLFAAFGVVWALIVNRAGWWAYVLGGFLAAIIAAVGYYVGAALQQHLADGLPITSLTLDEVLAKLRASEHLLTALVAAIAARESFTWVGGIAAARGGRVSRANRRARLSYEKRMAERAAETAEANGDDA